MPKLHNDLKHLEFMEPKVGKGIKKLEMYRYVNQWVFLFIKSWSAKDKMFWSCSWHDPLIMTEI